MRSLRIWSLFAAVCSVAASSLQHRDYTKYEYYAVHLNPSTPPAQLASHLGLVHEGLIGQLVDHHLFKRPKQDSDVVRDALSELKRRRRKRGVDGGSHLLDSVLFSQKQKIKPRMWKRSVVPEVSKRVDPISHAEDTAVAKQRELAEALGIEDPIFNDQWHLYNTKEPGNDMNVTGVWLQGITGKGATVCIIDDGLDMDSEDLKDNYYAKGSHDFNDKGDVPKPRLADDRHGTRCAGEVAAVKNNVCGVGVAWDAKVSGVRILSGDITDVDEALAVNYEYEHNQIYSCSWGPPDDGKTMQGPGILIVKAMLTAIQKGREGKGSIYVFATGNGAASDDNCNFDGYTNSIYSVTVGSIDKKNLHPYYSEACSAQLVVTYSSGSGDAIHTTDVGENQCYSSHGGTSASGPLAAGIYALVLEVRPEVTWRDIQWLSVMSAVPFDSPSGNDWQMTPIGKKYSHQFGYGKLDAYQIVEAAKNWTLVKPQAWFYSPWMHVKQTIPQGDKGIVSVFKVTEDMLKDANLARVEHVTITMNIEHSRRGDLSVELRSPSGVVSHLSTARKMDEANAGYVDWTFMTVAHWGESGLGDWAIVVKDSHVNDHEGKFTDWRMKIWGESIDPQKAKELPMPSEHDDDDHDKEEATTISVDAHTTTVSVPPTKTLPTVPSDHPDRPVNQKPTNTNTSPTSTADASEEETSATASATPDNFLPSPFPTFGVSKKTQIWIYGAIAIIIVFCGALALYMMMARRKRLRNTPRDDYEFEMLNDEDDSRGAGLNGAGAGGRKKRRAGELYDAFAGESDEDLFSDEEMEAYRDEKDEDDAASYDEKTRAANVTPPSEASGSSSSAAGSKTKPAR